jgi:hypothetical protein
MTNKIEKSDFTFTFVGYGQYDIVYTSPNTFRRWKKHVADNYYIDNVITEDSPKVKDLETLKTLCKTGVQLPPKRWD